MNEWEWLTCTDPEVMTEYLDRLTFDWFRSYVVTTILKTDAEKANLIREVVGNPFRPVVEKAHCKWCDTELPQPIPNSCPRCNTYNGKVEFWYRFIFIWITPSIRDFAQNIINSGDYGSVDVLADMLEEAGCDNEEILRHLRGEVRCAECGGDEIARRDGPIFCTVCCNSCWLPKPVPCQPGCWVLRLLTEPQPPPDQSVTFRAGEIEG